MNPVNRTIRMIYPGVTARYISDPYELDHRLNMPTSKRDQGNLPHTQPFDRALEEVSAENVVRDAKVPAKWARLFRAIMDGARGAVDE